MRAPPESFSPTTGAPSFIARSMIFTIFAALVSDREPSITGHSSRADQGWRRADQGRPLHLRGDLRLLPILQEFFQPDRGERMIEQLIDDGRWTRGDVGAHARRLDDVNRVTAAGDQHL